MNLLWKLLAKLRQCTNFLWTLAERLKPSTSFRLKLLEKDEKVDERLVEVAIKVVKIDLPPVDGDVTLTVDGTVESKFAMESYGTIVKKVAEPPVEVARNVKKSAEPTADGTVLNESPENVNDTPLESGFIVEIGDEHSVDIDGTFADIVVKSKQVIDAST